MDMTSISQTLSSLAPLSSAEFAQIEGWLTQPANAPDPAALMADQFVLIGPGDELAAVFDIRGACEDESNLPVCLTLKRLLSHWALAYNALFEDVFVKPHEVPGLKIFARAGYDIACLVKAELPDWRVDYCDQYAQYLSAHADDQRVPVTFEVTRSMASGLTPYPVTG